VERDDGGGGGRKEEAGVDSAMGAEHGGAMARWRRRRGNGEKVAARATGSETPSLKIRLVWDSGSTQVDPTHQYDAHTVSFFNKRCNIASIYFISKKRIDRFISEEPAKNR
jgi:hypothetical protein